MSEHAPIPTAGSPPAWAGRLRACTIAVCVCFYVLNLHSLQIGHHVDDGAYVSLGRSLNSGLGYVRFADPTHPPELQYPPAFALLVAGVLRVFGDDVEHLRFIPLVFSIISLLLADAFFRRRLSRDITGSLAMQPRGAEKATGGIHPVDWKLTTSALREALASRSGRPSVIVVLRDGAELDDDLRREIAARVRSDCSPRHVPDEVIAIGEVPRTLSGKALELPVKRILQGRPLDQAVSRESLANPRALDPFVDLAAHGAL